MWKLMLGPQLITNWDHEIIYDQSQLAWFAHDVWYCDSEKQMNVVYEPIVQQADGAPNVVG